MVTPNLSAGFMWSYPNLIPLPRAAVTRLWTRSSLSSSTASTADSGTASSPLAAEG